MEAGAGLPGPSAQPLGDATLVGRQEPVLPLRRITGRPAIVSVQLLPAGGDLRGPARPAGQQVSRGTGGKDLAPVAPITASPAWKAWTAPSGRPLPSPWSRPREALGRRSYWGPPSRPNTVLHPRWTLSVFFSIFAGYLSFYFGIYLTTERSLK